MISNAARRLARDVENFGHITTGFLGTSRISRVLTQNGYPNLAYMLLFRQKYPSWLYPITKGATTIWERWDGIKPDGSFQNDGMNSFNHYAYGAVGKWMYASVAGIDLDPKNPGYKNIIIKPYTTKELNFAKAEYHSIYGKISSSWEIKSNLFILDVQIPPNTTADVFLPTEVKENISENGKQIDNEKAIRFVKTEGGKTVLNIGSGKYHFVVNHN